MILRNPLLLKGDLEFMICKQCAYYWQDDGETFAKCNYNSMGDWDYPPCEQEENENEEQ